MAATGNLFGTSKFRRRLHPYEAAELEPLDLAARGQVVLVGALDETECWTQLGRERFWLVPRDGEPAATLGSVRRERTDDGLATRGQHGSQRPLVLRALLRADQEVEDGPVVPDVEDALRRPSCDIGSGPGDVLRQFPEPRPGACEGLGRDVEDRHLPESVV